MPRQLSLVSFYGEKPRPLIELVDAAQGAIASCVPGFEPYAAGQVHATIIGLEATGASESGRTNANFLRHWGETRDMDIMGLVASLARDTGFPMAIQVGGFAPGDTPFLSRERPPSDRTFSIQGDKAVLMGWPIGVCAHTHDLHQSAGEYPQSLERLRRSARAFGVLHAWHRRPGDIDNDFYLRLGLFDAPPSRQDIDTVSASLQALLSVRHIFECTLDDLWLVSYVDEALPLGSTRACRVTDAGIGDFVATQAGAD